MGFKADDEALTAIMKHHRADKTDYLLIDDFMSKLMCWGNNELANKAIDEHIDSNLNNLRSKANKNSVKPAVHNDKPKLKIKAQQKPAVKMESVSSVEEKPKRQLPNKSKHYLKLASKKEEEEQKALAMNVEKCKKELEFD